MATKPNTTPTATMIPRAASAPSLGATCVTKNAQQMIPTRAKYAGCVRDAGGGRRRGCAHDLANRVWANVRLKRVMRVSLGGR